MRQQTLLPLPSWSNSAMWSTLHCPAAPADPLVDIDTATKNEPQPSGGDFGEDDLYVAAYDKEGRSLGVLSLAEAASNYRN